MSCILIIMVSHKPKQHSSSALVQYCLCLIHTVNQRSGVLISVSAFLRLYRVHSLFFYLFCQICQICQISQIRQIRQIYQIRLIKIDSFFIYHLKWHRASLAQLAERVTFNLKVVGSKPAGGQPFFNLSIIVCFSVINTCLQPTL